MSTATTNPELGHRIDVTGIDTNYHDLNTTSADQPPANWHTALPAQPDLSQGKRLPVPHPASLVHGRDDQVIPLQATLRPHQRLDRSELHVFGRCEHWVQINAGDWFAELVNTFLTH